jgi:uncharacterized membrane protein
MKTKSTWRIAWVKGQDIEREAEIAVSGAVAGVVVGAAAGPPGAIVGAVLGGVAGTIAGAALKQENLADAARMRELDAEIGVSEGELGAPNLQHPLAIIGAYSAASAGTRSVEPTPAEGPIEAPKS